jgi:ComEC/Rec2-related protein
MTGWPELTGIVRIPQGQSSPEIALEAVAERQAPVTVAAGSPARAPPRRFIHGFRVARPSHFLPALRLAWSEERAFGHPFLFLPLLVAIGASLWFSAEDPPGLHETAALACAFCMAAVGTRYRAGLARLRTLRLVLAAVAALSLGAMSAAIETETTATIMLDAAVTTDLLGSVVSREIAGRHAYRYVVDIRATDTPTLRRAPARITLVARNAGGPAAVGAIVSGRVRLSPPSGPALPGLNDFGFDSYFKGIGAVGYAYGKLEIRPGEARRPNGRLARLLDAITARISVTREAIGVRIRATIPGDAGAIGAALVTAEERAIGRDAIDALRNAGLGHVLAISGLNMVLAAGTLLVGLRTVLSLVPGLAHRVPIKKIAAAGALIMVCLYILISGGAVSAVRSWIMIVIMLVAVFVDRPSISLRNVTLAALVILAFDPSAVGGPGFQMSFAATLALVAGYGRWRERKAAAFAASGPSSGVVSDNAILSGLRGFLAGLFMSSLIGGFSTMVYSAGHFNQLPAFGLLGNMLAMPVIGIVVMPAALVSMLLMPLGLDVWPLQVMGAGLEVMMAVARFVSSFGGQVRTGEMPQAAFALIAIGGVVLCLLRTWLAVSGLALIVAGLAVIVFAPIERPAIVVAEDGRLVALLDGQAAATNRTRPPAFVFGQWERALRLDRHDAPFVRPDLALPEPAAFSEPGAFQGDVRARPPFDAARAKAALAGLIASARTGRFVCVPRQWCAATSRQGWVVVTVEDRRLVGAACDLARIVVTSFVTPFAACRSGALLASGSLLRRHGALEILPDAAGGLRVVGAVEGLRRPWQRHRAYDWRSGAFVDDVAIGEDALDEDS